MGALALLLLFAADAALGFFDFGRSLSDQLAAFGPPAGMIRPCRALRPGEQRAAGWGLGAGRRRPRDHPQEIRGRLARISRQDGPATMRASWSSAISRSV
jgi:hypothetical protein